MNIKSWLLIFVIAGNCSAATHYIDFSSGSDANPGTSESAPWKHHPYMTGWTGSYAHASGDRFIFKGGVTWDHTCFGGTVTGPATSGFLLQAGGSSSASDYYGVDLSWFAGSSWVRPIFDGGYISSDIFLLNEQSYVTIDNLELKSVLCGSAAYEGLVFAYASSNILIENCYLHGWRLVSSVTADDAHGAVIFYFSTGNSQAGNTLTNCVVTNIENANTPVGQNNAGANGQNSQNGEAIREVQTISNCTVHDVSSAIVFTGNCHNNTIYNVSYPSNNYDFDSQVFHENGIYLDNGGSSTSYCYSNRIYNVGGGANSIYPNPHGQTQYIYDNLIYGSESEQLAIEIDPYEYGSEGGGSCYVYNNTIVNFNNGAPGIHVVARPDPINVLSIVNNHVIYPSSGTLTDAVQGTTVTKLTESNNLVESAATATAQGYTLANLYAPTSASSPTVNTGTSEAGTFTTDIMGTPITSGWDIGAYEYTGGVVVPTPTPTPTPSPTPTPTPKPSPTPTPPLSPAAPVISSKLTVTGTIGSPFSYSITASGSPTSFRATPLPAGLSASAVTGLISGTVTSASTTNVTIDATNASGMGTATLVLTFKGSAPAPTPTPTPTAAPSPTPTPINRLVDFSARAFVGAGTDPLIGGFAIGGTTPQTLLICAMGPALGGLGVPNFLSDPVLTIYDSSGLKIYTISGWGNNATGSPGSGIVGGDGIVLSPATAQQIASVGATPLVSGSSDSALVVSLPAGTYTAQVTSSNGTTGVSLLEMYVMQ